MLTSAVWADGLVDNPPLQPIVRGDMVRYPADGFAVADHAIQLRYFASLREALGPGETIELPRRRHAWPARATR